MSLIPLMTTAKALHIYHQLKSKVGTRAKNEFYVLKIIVARDLEHAKQINADRLMSGLPYMPEKYIHDTDEVEVFVFFTDGKSGNCQHYLKYINENDILLT